MGEEVEARAAWGGQLEFILTCVGFAVGLGNVWRFPYLTFQNGGGAFLIPYICMLLFVGLPLFYLEVSFGQFASLGPITIWKMSPIFKGVGFAGIIVASYICMYYNVIVAWCLYYFFASMTSVLPWSTCDNWWNTPNCLVGGLNRTGLSNETIANLSRLIKTPSEEYFYNYVLRQTDSIEDMGEFRWQLALTLFLAWTIIFLVLLKGIASLGKASYFMSLFPYVLLTAMLIRGATLPGAWRGVEYYIRPDFSKLANLNVWSEAATQIFYSLGCCMGALISMASFNPFKNNVLRDALLIPFVNCGTSVYAGFVIFSVLGYMAEEKGLEVKDVARDGPGLVFVVYPEGLATMPVAPLWAILFFFMMTTLGFSSQFSTAEGIVAAIMDEFPHFFKQGRRPLIFRGVLCFTFFLMGLPMCTGGGFYIFDIINNYSAGYPLIIVGFLEIVAIIFVYGYNNFAKDIEMMLGGPPFIFWRITWCFLSPVLLLTIFVLKCIDQSPLKYSDGTYYPNWANAIAWLIVAFPITVLLANFLWETLKHGGWEIIKQRSNPEPEWGPSLKENRTGKYAIESIMLEDQTSSASDTPSNAPPAYDNVGFVVDEKVAIKTP